MNTQQLQGFITVVKEGSISRAAKKICIAQSALSAQMNALESETGCKLLIRCAKGVTLSGAGEMFYFYAVKTLNSEQEMKRQLLTYSSGGSGVLRLAISPSCIFSLSTETMRIYLRCRPNIRYEIHESDAAEIIEMLRDDRAELGLVHSTALPLGDITIHHQCKEPMALLYEKKLGISEDSFLSDIKNIPLYITENSLKQLNPMCQTLGFLPDIVGTCRQYDTAAVLAANGNGAALVPVSIAKNYARLQHEDKRSYVNAQMVKIYNSCGARTDKPVGNASGNAEKSSLLLEKGFDGYLLFPLDITATVPLCDKCGQERLPLTELNQITGMTFDFRLSSAKKGQKYSIGGILLVNSIEDVYNNTAHALDDFKDESGIAQHWRMQDLSVYNQLLSFLSVANIDGLSSLVITVPQNGQTVDTLKCGHDLVRSNLLPYIDRYKYMAVRITNLEIDGLAVSLFFKESVHMQISSFHVPQIEAKIMVISAQKTLSAPAEAFVQALKSSSFLKNEG